MSVFDDLYASHPILYDVLRLMRVIDGTSTADADLRLERLGEFLINPLSVGENYGWGTANFDANELASRLNTLMRTLGFAAEYDEASDEELTFSGNARMALVPFVFLVRGTGARFLPVAARSVGGTDAGFGLAASPLGTPTLEVELFQGWTLKASVIGADALGFGVILRPRENVTLGFVNGDPLSQIALRFDFSRPIETSLIGVQGAEVSAGRVGVMFQFARGGETKSAFDLALEQGTFKFVPSDKKSFISSFLPDSGFTINFDAGIGWEEGKGVQVRGGGELRVIVPLHLKIGPIAIQTLELAIEARSGSPVAIVAAFDLSVDTGPVSMAFDRLGTRLSLVEDGSGNLGPMNLSATFKGPNGIGVAVDMPPVKGGGYLFHDDASDEYAGVVQLAVAETFDLKATGLIGQTPDGEFSMLFIGSLEFMPPIQLFAGFALGGVGILVGINRAMNGDALRAGVREGNLDTVLFPKDPIKNARRIVSSLAKFFPPTKDTYVFGAMGLVVWGAGGFFELKVGLALEVPHHIKLLVAAILDISLSPQRGEVLRLRQDVLGFWDSGTGELTVDGYLFDSVVAGFVVSGSSHFRNKSSKGFILSVGGFHPAFTPPADLTDTDRVAISMSAGPLKIRIEGYFAITSNTLQAGARAELRAGGGKFRVEGWMGVDMLFQYDPFHVLVDFSAGVAIKAGGTTLMSLTLNANLDGFTPTKIRGKVSFKILFVRIRIPVELTFGKSSKRSFEKADVLALLRDELAQQRNWATDMDRADGQGVTLREPQPVVDNALLAHPLAPLSVRQQLVPLAVEIEAFKSAKPVDQKEFYIKEVIVGDAADPLNLDFITPLSDDFAPAQYFTYSDDEKLSAPSFEQMESGARIITSEIEFGDETDLTSREMHYETEILDREEDEWRKREDAQRRYFLFLSVLLALSALSTLARKQREINAAKYYPRGQKVTVKPQRFVVAERVSGQLQLASTITPEPTSHTQASVALRQFRRSNAVAVARDPNRYRVIGAHEL